jgi:hypothetical protein
MRNRTKLGLAAVVSVTGFIVACGDDASNPGSMLPSGGTGVVGGGGNPATGGGGAAGTVATGGAAAGTFSMAGTGGDVAGTGGTGGTGGAAGGTGGTDAAGTGGTPVIPMIKPTVFLIDNIRLQLKPPCGSAGGGGTGGGGTGGGGTGGGGTGGAAAGNGGTGGVAPCNNGGGGGTGGTSGAGGTGGGGAGGTGGGGAGGTGGAGAGGGGTGGTGGTGGDTGGGGTGGGGTGGTGGVAVVPDPSPTPFNYTFDADVLPLAKNPNGFSPGPGLSMGPAIIDNTFLTFEPTMGHPGGAAKISVPFTVKQQQADFGTAFVPASVNGTGYEILADVNMAETGDVADCATVWLYVYGGSGYANDKSGEPSTGVTSHLKKGEWSTVRLDLDGPYGQHSVNNGAYKPEHVGIWGIQLNTWGCP